MADAILADVVAVRSESPAKEHIFCRRCELNSHQTLPSEKRGGAHNPGSDAERRYAPNSRKEIGEKMEGLAEVIQFKPQEQKEKKARRDRGAGRIFKPRHKNLP